MTNRMAKTYKVLGMRDLNTVATIMLDGEGPNQEGIIATPECRRGTLHAPLTPPVELTRWQRFKRWLGRIV